MQYVGLKLKDKINKIRQETELKQNLKINDDEYI